MSTLVVTDHPTRSAVDKPLSADSLPLVSIIMPAYNAAGTLAQSVESVLCQTYPNWELIIVNDNSTDATREIALSYAARDSRIRLIDNAENIGVAEARNAALRSTTNVFIAFLDSDDLWEPDKLKAQLQFMLENNHAITYTFYRRFKSDRDELSAVVESPAALTYDQLLRNSAMACLTVMLDRRKCGEIAFSSIRHEDFALWLQVLKRGVVAYCLPQDLARYRVSENSLSSNKLKSSVWVWKVYRNSENLTMTKSFWCFCQYVMRAVSKRVGREKTRVRVVKSV